MPVVLRVFVSIIISVFFAALFRQLMPVKPAIAFATPSGSMGFMRAWLLNFIMELVYFLLLYVLGGSLFALMVSGKKTDLHKPAILYLAGGLTAAVIYATVTFGSNSTFNPTEFYGSVVVYFLTGVVYAVVYHWLLPKQATRT
ncbi:hypothetical protein [Solirubrum puertoriconensis]|uniref:Uncharacterized protein n=1 Tax=Solirubrum puertoriconensis TaxID=1751427 RepID=A0A9X0L375_SOLP1|nr:hypothetical protein [Solirubrum puertoriconensis]KUG06186.1 hypothetical protein ASU33_02115 [Solirubrum puertoriconensis]